MTTIGPRSTSSLRVTRSSTTRSGRLSASLSMIASYGDVLSVGAHDETPLCKPVECLPCDPNGRVDFRGDVAGVCFPETIGRVPRATLDVCEHADDLYAVFLLHREREPVSLENSFDCVPVVFAHAAKKEVSVVRARLIGVSNKKLCNDFVGA